MTMVETNGGTWRARPLLLGGIGALAALLVQQVLDVAGTTPAWRTALGCALLVAALAFGFSIERRRIGWVSGFAVGLGAVAGLILYWNDAPQVGTWGDWRYLALLLGLAITVPLFQAAHAEGAWRFPYDRVYGAVWTNVVLWCAACVFTGIAFALAWLLAGLFGLIGLHVLRDLLRHDWASAMLAGAAFGGALGLLRERAAIVTVIQHVVTAVLGVLAPILAVGLVLFLCALPFTGLGALWEATKATTPILLACVIGALILANAVIGDGVAEGPANPALRWAALALAVAILPLAAIAALATGLRIQQYGYSPDRLWALVFVVLATVCAVAYVGSVVRGRQRWPAYARDANLTLAFVVAGVALVLATPLVGFNAISTRDQVARLERGTVPPEKFDWAALAFDFGAPGKAAVKRLAGSDDRRIAALARRAATAERRWQLADADAAGAGAASLARRIRIVPRAVPLPAGLLESFARAIGDRGRAVLRYEPGDASAVLLVAQCHGCGATVIVSRRNPEGSWRSQDVPTASSHASSVEDRRALESALVERGFDLRTVRRRQVFVAGQPVGEPFE